MKDDDIDEDVDPDDEDDDEREDDDEDDDNDPDDVDATPWAVNRADWTTEPRCACQHPVRARSEQAAIDAIADHCDYVKLPRTH